MIQPPGASIAKLLAMPQPRSAYTPSVTRSTRFVSPMPHFSLASSAARVVTAPFGPTTVSLRRDGLLQDGGDCAAARSVDWARAPRDGANAIDAQVSIARRRFRTTGYSMFGTRDAPTRIDHGDIAPRRRALCAKWYSRHRHGQG